MRIRSSENVENIKAIKRRTYPEFCHVLALLNHKKKCQGSKGQQCQPTKDLSHFSLSIKMAK